MEEIEVKFLNVNHGEIQKKLKEIGAENRGEFFQRWVALDYPDWRLDKKGAWIRVRDEGNGKTTLAFKQRLGIESFDGEVNDKGMKEIEVLVNDFEKTVSIFKEMGFIEKHYAEKKRIKWVKDDIEFDLETYPALEPFLEIESTSWEKIDEAINLLGLDPKDKKIFTGTQVYAMKGIDVKKLKRITFDKGLS